jgi:PAT family beta-lactamase induction signal transducer AmpG
MIKSSIIKSKLSWVGVLYVAEGFPLGVFYEILPVHFRMQGIDLSEIDHAPLPIEHEL